MVFFSLVLFVRSIRALYSQRGTREQVCDAIFRDPHAKKMRHVAAAVKAEHFVRLYGLERACFVRGTLRIF